MQVDFDLFNNEYIIIKNDIGNVVDKFRFDGEKLEQVKKRKFKNTNVLTPLDEIQMCAYDMLFRNDILCCCLIGLSGTGKTKTAISVGLELLKSGVYEKLILIRHAEVSGKDIGFLKGTYEDKLINWCGCFYDNLNGEKYEFDELLNKGKIQIESVAHLKGRNFKNSYVIFDEAEDCLPEQMEIIGTRQNDNCKLVCVGDYRQVSNRKYLLNNGLLQLINKAKGKNWFGVIELITNGRGKMAEFFATEYKT